MQGLKDVPDLPACPFPWFLYNWTFSRSTVVWRSFRLLERNKRLLVTLYLSHLNSNLPIEKECISNLNIDRHQLFNSHLSISMPFKLAGWLGLLLSSSSWWSRSWHRSPLLAHCSASDQQTLFPLFFFLKKVQFSSSYFYAILPTLLSDTQDSHTSKRALCWCQSLTDKSSSEIIRNGLCMSIYLELSSRLSFETLWSNLRKVPCLFV